MTGSRDTKPLPVFEENKNAQALRLSKVIHNGAQYRIEYHPEDPAPFFCPCCGTRVLL